MPALKNKSVIASNTWLTPKTFYEYLHNRFQFDDFDPCPPDCDLSVFNGLEVEWADRTFCNPPYSRKEKEEFIRKAHKESLKGKLAVMLIPASTSTKIFHDLIKVYAKVEFIRGRLNFEGIDGDGNWCNPGEGMIPLPNVPEGCPQVRRAGQNDLMLVIFGEP